MTNKNIPVLILNNVTLFPSTDVRMDFDSSLDRNIIKIADNHFNGQILIVNKVDPLEEAPDFSDLYNVGVLAQITMKLELPNNRLRLTLAGIKRVKIDSFYHEDEIVYAKYSNVLTDLLDAKEEIAYLRIIKRITNDYISNIPYTTNTLLSTIKDINELDVLTDVICATFDFPYYRKQEYIEEFDAKVRANMLIEDIKQDFDIVEIEKEIDEEVNRRLDKSQRDYVLREKIKVIKEEIGDIQDKDEEIEELRIKINSLDTTEAIRNKLLKELHKYEMCQAMSPEINIIRNYIDLMLDLPYNVYTENDIDLNLIRKSLDDSHYGMEEVKSRIIDYMALKKWNNDASTAVLCLVGPPGVGKTTLAKSIALSLGKKSTKISVGGIQDEADIVGHRRTYIGAMPGMIINGMKKAGVSDPVFIIDEIDKMSKSIHGDPASSLLEVLDKEQNNAFVDHYVEEEYDLSKVMFITTANYIDQIPTELLDRLEVIELSSYTELEKLNICKYHLIKNKMKEYKLEKVNFLDEAILYIIRNYTLEAGVRELDRLIGKILRKVIREQLENEGLDNSLIDIDAVKKYLGTEIYDYNHEKSSGVGVVNGLSYTIVGGDTLEIEATAFKGKGEILLTGSLGDVIKESSMIAFNYIKSNCDKFDINIDEIMNKDIHLHFPEGAIKKDGPSAGTAITTVLLSLLKNVEIPSIIAMTGEITLRGKVLPIGGLKEKLIGAKKRGVKKVFIPLSNKKDIDNLDKEIKENLEIIYVKEYNDIYNNLFLDNKVKKTSRKNKFMEV